MANVRNLRLLFEIRPTIHVPAGVVLRHYGGKDDSERWLSIRNRAFAREKVGVGSWDAGDFAREFLEKPWWSPERMWFAEVAADGEPITAGTVTWADRGRAPEVKAAVHWLAVLPGYRRRGVGRLLLETLHQACWDAGHREVFLETHTAWSSAAKLYESLGYQPA